MTDETHATPEASAQEPAIFQLKSQYIKDISFENPRAPGIFMQLKEPPMIDVAVDLRAERFSETLFELTIQINVRAMHEKTTVFLIDLAYAGLFEAKGIPQEHLEQAVLVQGAFLLFPFARRIISEVTRDGGFPALNLEPIDFFALHEQNKQRSHQA